MEDEDEKFPSLFLTSNLSLLNIPSPNPESPQHSGLATPPLQILASVPFKWEEKPGKPLPCTAIISVPESTKFLELPPCRLQFIEPTNKIGKTPSPTAVLDGPYGIGRSKFSSFRFFRENRDSFDSYGSVSPESAVDDMFIGKKMGGGQSKTGLFGMAQKLKGGKREVDGVLSCSTSCESDGNCRKVKVEGKIRRKGSFYGVSHTKSTWAAVYEGLKQVIQWKSAKK